MRRAGALTVFSKPGQGGNELHLT